MLCRCPRAASAGSPQGWDGISAAPRERQRVSVYLQQRRARQTSKLHTLLLFYRKRSRMGTTFFWWKRSQYAPVGRVIFYEFARLFASSLSTCFPLMRSRFMGARSLLVVARLVHLLSTVLQTSSRHPEYNKHDQQTRARLQIEVPCYGPKSRWFCECAV